MNSGTQLIDNLTELTVGTDRVERLRDRAGERAFLPGSDNESDLLIARSWIASGGIGSHILRRGMLARDLLTGQTPVIDDDELIVGKFCRRSFTDEERAELDIWMRYGEPSLDRAWGQQAHMTIDLQRVLRQGVSGVKSQIEGFRSRLDLSRPEDMEKDFFYHGCLEALGGMVALANKYADEAQRQATETADRVRKAELVEIARICRKVPEFPAETFAEAAQSAHFATFCMCAGNKMLMFQLGRPDRYLIPHYLRDIAAGRITPEYAQELIDCMGIMLNEYTPRGLAIGLMVGGRDENGLDITNELSYMFVRSVGHVRLAYPGVGICWNSETPDDLMTLASRLLSRGYSHPAIFNDDVITRGLLRLGLPYRDACLYIHSTCVEITPIAISNVYVASPYVNLVQCLHDLIGVPRLGAETLPLCFGTDVPKHSGISSFTDLMAQYRQRLSDVIRQEIIGQNTCMLSRKDGGGFPLLSCFVNDCLREGKDIDQGGARANWIEPSFVGLANLIDSLTAIRQFVFDEGKIDLDRLREALIANYDGYDDVKNLMASAPKYGNDNDIVDLLAQEITGYLLAECDQYRTPHGDPFVPGFFCWVMHERLGRETAASPDGRPAGFPLADGSGPAQGREKFGPTAAVLSSTKWDHSPMIGGIAVNMRFHPGRNRDDLVEPMKNVLKTFLELGGFEAQVNVVDAEILREAQKHPEQYRDLVVRVAGYSDYFVGLSPEMQAEVMTRSELNCE